MSGVERGMSCWSQIFNWLFLTYTVWLEPWHSFKMHLIVFLFPLRFLALHSEIMDVRGHMRGVSMQSAGQKSRDCAPFEMFAPSRQELPNRILSRTAGRPIIRSNSMLHTSPIPQVQLTNNHPLWFRKPSRQSSSSCSFSWKCSLVIIQLPRAFILLVIFCEGKLLCKGYMLNNLEHSLHTNPQ